MTSQSLNQVQVAKLPVVLLSISPLFYTVADAIDKNVWLLVSLAMVCIVAQDRKNLDDAGLGRPSGWLILFYPVYLWRRVKFVGTGKKYFWTWIGLVLLLLCIGALTSYADERSNLESSSCSLVSKILKDQSSENSASCVKVSIDSDVTDKFHKATATLNNGADIKITIEEQPNNTIYVRIPPTSLLSAQTGVDN